MTDMLDIAPAPPVDLDLLEAPIAELCHFWARAEGQTPEKWSKAQGAVLWRMRAEKIGWCPWPAWRIAEALLARMASITPPEPVKPSVGRCECGAAYVGAKPAECFFCGKEVK